MSETVRNWTIGQREYMFWLTTPDDDRVRNTHAAIAEQVGVAERTLYRWQKLPGFWAEVNKIVDEHLADDFAEVAKALKREARKGSIQHIRTYLEMIGKYAPSLRVDHRVTMLQELDRIAEQEHWDEVQMAAAVREAERILAGVS